MAKHRRKSITKKNKTKITIKKLEEKHRDYFVFGHRHLPLDIELNERSKYINLGDWIGHYSYAVFDNETLFLKTF